MSDKIGRRPLFFAGLGGNAVFNALFGLGSDLVTLYVARILSGIFSSAILPTATAYVADASSDSDRGKSMAWPCLSQPLLRWRVEDLKRKSEPLWAFKALPTASANSPGL